MRLKKLPRSKKTTDVLTGIAPIFKVSLEGKAELIGTGFWVTETGHLVTAWHVIADNIGEDGIDSGPIYAMQTLPNRTALPRTLRKSCKHETFDLALSETSAGFEETNEIQTRPLPLTLDEPQIGSPISTYAFISTSQNFTKEKYAGQTTVQFRGLLAIPELDITYNLTFSARIGSGYVTNIFEKARDSVMLPFPCIQSDMPVYGANSGGPVFNNKGHICAVNCTSYEGADISFHIPLRGILDLWARDIEFIPEDPISRNRTIAELGLAKRTPFYPPLIEVFFTFKERLILRPYHFFLDSISWVRWFLSNR